MATWQAAQPGTVVGDDKGNYQIQIGGQWMPMPKGSLTADEHGAFHFDSDVIKPPPAPKATPAPVDASNPANTTTEGTEGPQGFANGLAELVGKGFGNMPMDAVHAVADIVSRATGHGGKPASAPTFPLSPNAQSVGQGISDTLRNAAAPYRNPLVDAAANTDFSKNYIAPVASDVAKIAPVVGAGVNAVKNIGGMVSDAADASAAATAAAAKSPAVAKYGLVTGDEHPIARNVAGTSARPTATASNQAIADPTLGAQVGIPQGQPLSAENFETGRGPANSVYGRLERSLPTGPLSPAAASTVNSIGSDDLVVHSPDTVNQIEAQKARLLGTPEEPAQLTGPQAVNTSKTLRFNGFGNIASEDPEKIALGRAQLKMADALHQHMLDTLPANADVSVEQLEGARRALAQSYTLQPFIKGGNVDLQQLAAFARRNPGLLRGPMADFADFADKYKSVSSLPSDAEQFNPSGVTKDVLNANIVNRPIGAVAQMFGGALARRALRGRPAPTTPVTGLAGEFGPIDHGPPQPPPGMTASPPVAPPPAAAGPPGQIPYADVLSHGVEQSPSPGLSVGPMGAPAQTGIPFAQNANHAAGGLSLADEQWLENFMKGENNSDLAKVASQGVPEDIMARTAQPNPAQPKVAHSPAFINQNASLGNPASLEAASRVKQGLAQGVQPVSFGQDDLEHVLSPHDIQGADLKPAPNSIVIDKSTGKVLDSGGMAPALVRNLLARWKAIHGGPGPLAGAFGGG